MKGGNYLHHEHHEDCACDHHHAPQEGCGCGHHHTHEDGCDCGNEHTHEEGCGCGHHHEHLVFEEGSITEAQADVLLAIHQRGYLPIARFALRSSRDGDAHAVALEPVYIASTEDDMDMVKANGELFESLEDLGLITLDYDIRLTGYAYQEYEQSNLYAYFMETVKEAAQKPEFLLDTPVLELGSVALTEEGHEVLRSMMEK
jgi:hypothetical protein